MPTNDFKPYRIRNWEKHFETADLRKTARWTWLKLPNAHDGLAYRRLTAHRDAIPMFSGFILMLQVASKMPERGVLANSDGALTAEDLSIMSGFPTEIFEKALNYLSSKEMGWIEGGPTQDHPDASGQHPDASRLDKSREEEKREEKKKEDPSRFHRDELPAGLDTDAFRGVWDRWVKYRKEIKAALKPTTIKAQLKKLAEWGEAKAITSLERSMECGWQGFFEPDAEPTKATPKSDDQLLVPSDQWKSRNPTPEDLL